MPYWIDPVDISADCNTAGGDWTTVDVSAYVPAGTTGVLLHIGHDNTTEHYGWFRCHGSANADRYSLARDQHWTAIGVDGNRQFDAACQSMTVLLIGYCKSEAVFPVEYSTYTGLTRDGTWHTLDLSALFGSDTPVAAFFYFTCSATSAVSVRKTGSTDDRIAASYTPVARGVIGVGTQSIDYKINGGSGTGTMYIFGWLNSGATFNANGSSLGYGGTSGYADLTVLPSGATGLFFEQTPVSAGRGFGVRKNGSSEDLYQTTGHAFGFVQCDGSQLVEAKVQATTDLVYLLGYSWPVTDKVRAQAVWVG